MGCLSEGKATEAFDELDRLGWIKEVPDGERYQALAAAYLEAVAEKNRGEAATALVISPTHAEAARVTEAIRAALKAEGRFGKEGTLKSWVPAQLTIAEKGEAVNYEPGDLLVFHQNVPGHQRGSRLVVADEAKLPLAHAKHFEVYRPVELSLAVGDRVRVTANGRDKSGKHRLNNGDLLTVKGFTSGGDIIDQRGWGIPAAASFVFCTKGESHDPSILTSSPSAKSWLSRLAIACVNSVTAARLIAGLSPVCEKNSYAYARVTEEFNSVTRAYA